MAHRPQQDTSTKEGPEATECRQRWWQWPPTRGTSPTRRRSHSSRPQPPSTPPTSPHPAPSPPAKTRTRGKVKKNLPRRNTEVLAERLRVSGGDTHHVAVTAIRAARCASAKSAGLERGGLRTSLLAQLFSCQRTPRRPTCPSLRPDRPTPHAERPRRGHACRFSPALPASLNAPAWPSQNAIAVSGGPPGATALSCSHPPQESTRMHRSTLRRT